ncbi:hypothetical protein BDV96DRAFT_335871 [Lophiotrema nucula]|uniref:Uncharacterized protein n=1 Tax=Lophiotrema nucula TaxID=690887 RepID=A0A6A5YGR6_9PLEO|nr:hypothetical protein BDV96DRAFT_335871 [Lophiotrema nucula]
MECQMTSTLTWTAARRRVIENLMLLRLLFCRQRRFGLADLKERWRFCGYSVRPVRFFRIFARPVVMATHNRLSTCQVASANFFCSKHTSDVSAVIAAESMHFDEMHFATWQDIAARLLDNVYKRAIL